jgi:hypothetical protein
MKKYELGMLLLRYSMREGKCGLRFRFYARDFLIHRFLFSYLLGCPTNYKVIFKYLIQLVIPMAPWVKSLAIAAFSVIVFLLVLGIFLFAVLLSIFPFSQFVRAYWGFFVVGSAFAIVLLVISLVKKSKWESETNAKKCGKLIYAILL